MPWASTSEPSTPEEREQTEKDWEQRKCDSYNASIGTLNEKDGYNCNLCKNRGYTAELRKSETFGYWSETLIPCKCQKVRATIQRLERSGLKNIIRDYTFAKYEDKEPWQKAIKTAAVKFCTDEENNWFYIGGQPGSGKTFICTAIAGYYLRHGKAAKYMLWRDDITKIKANITDSQAYAAAMDELKHTEVLYIDDLFKSGKGQDGKPTLPTAADINIAFEILNYRYNNKNLITIISSERRLQEIAEIDEAVGGRIAERVMCAGYGFNIKPDKTKNLRMNGLVEL